MGCSVASKKYFLCVTRSTGEKNLENADSVSAFVRRKLLTITLVHTSGNPCD